MSNQSVVLCAQQLGKAVNTSDGLLTILHDISFSVCAGESVAIVGVSGSGKSTLLSILAGLDTPSSGVVELVGENLAQLSEDGRAQLRGKHVGFVFQSFQLIPHLSALENVMLPLELRSISLNDAREQAHYWLDKVGLSARLNHFQKTLSGGEQQRVALARAFVGKPAILFADEPTGSLDQASGGRVIDLLFDLNQANGSTLILVTHDAVLAGRCARQLHLHAGALLAE